MGSSDLNGDKIPADTEIVGQLSRWRNDADLAGVRAPEELAKLSESESQESLALWAKIEALFHQAPERAARPTHPPAKELPADPFAP